MRRFGAAGNIDRLSAFYGGTQSEAVMDKDRIKGSAEQAKVKVKETAGKALGDEKMKTEGKADQVKGKVQNAVGGLKDTLREK